MDTPIRISRDRVWLYGSALFIAGLWQLVNTTLRDPNLADWSCFWAGGATAGTRELLDPHLHSAFQSMHGYVVAIWPYLPAFAWLFVPAAHLSLLAGYAANAALMFGCAAVAGALLAEAFDFPRWIGVVAALAWAPVKIAALGGQNTPLALLLISIAVLAARRRETVVVGLAVGALCYKPTIVAPFLLLLVLRREWRAIVTAALCSSFWYLGSVSATGGDWFWPKQYIAAIIGYATNDFTRNAPNVISVPGALARAGMPLGLAAAFGVVLIVFAALRLRRAPLADALAAMSVTAVAASIHAWSYESAIMLPALFYLTRIGSSGAWIIAASYVVADLSLVELHSVAWNLQILVVLGVAVAVQYRKPEALYASNTSGAPQVTVAMTLSSSSGAIVRRSNNRRPSSIRAMIAGFSRLKLAAKRSGRSTGNATAIDGIRAWGSDPPPT